uniref:Uncharacterized protein n=1 Tax=Agrobacterium tumefaciens TaxID=358 RepID=A0A2Z2PRE1_AGRTU|nr:hypothetical protein [Agrobacterium tumefaciens]
MRLAPSGIDGPAPCQPFSVFSSFQRHFPDRGADGPVQLRPSISARLAKRGLQPCAGRRAGIASGAVERKRQRPARSASKLPPFPIFSFQKSDFVKSK